MVKHNQLRRQDGIIGGVCGGLGAFYGLNPWLFRIAFLAMIPITWASPIIPYLLLWLVIPRRR